MDEAQHDKEWSITGKILYGQSKKIFMIFTGSSALNLVASYFFKTKETMNLPHGIFYSPEKGGVDFLLSDIMGEIIPVEVGIGKKGKGQIKRVINKYNSKYGIVVLNATKKITREEDVIFVPMTTFSFL